MFVDGGVGTAKNPALQLFMLATMKGYDLQWPLGAENLLLVSIGTGRTPLALSHQKVNSRPALLMALESLFLVLDDTDMLVQTMLQWLSDSPTAWEFDDEIGDLRGDLLAGQALLSYRPARRCSPICATTSSSKMPGCAAILVLRCRAMKSPVSPQWTIPRT